MGKPNFCGYFSFMILTYSQNWQKFAACKNICCTVYHMTATDWGDILVICLSWSRVEKVITVTTPSQQQPVKQLQAPTGPLQWVRPDI